MKIPRSLMKKFTLALAFHAGYVCGRRIITWRMVGDQIAIVFGVATTLAFAVGFAILGLERVFIGNCQ